MWCDEMRENCELWYQVSHYQSVVTAMEVATAEVYLRSCLVVGKKTFVNGINMSLTDEP